MAYGNQQSSVQRYISEKLWDTKLKNYLLFFVKLKSEDPNDELFLTSAHFCWGGKLENLHLSQITNDLKNPDSTHSSTKRWTQIQNMVSHFCKRWVKEYVLSLRERYKWKQETSDLKVGDFVFVIDDNDPPLQWRLAKIQHVYTGPDMFVRVVKIKTATGIYNRPVHKLNKMLMLISMMISYDFVP